MSAIAFNGEIFPSGARAASDQVYDNSNTGLPANVQGAIDKTTGNISSLDTVELTATAAHAHAVGTSFMLIGQLVKTTSAIEVGDTIAVGTNVEPTSVLDLLEDVNAAISTLNSKMPACYNFDKTPYNNVWGVWLSPIPSPKFQILDFTPPHSGKYLINLSVGVNTNDVPGTETYIAFEIRKKATDAPIAGNLQDAGGFYRAMTNMNFITQLAQNETITIYFVPRNLTSLRLLHPESSYVIFFG